MSNLIGYEFWEEGIGTLSISSFSRRRVDLVEFEDDSYIYVMLYLLLDLLNTLGNIDVQFVCLVTILEHTLSISNIEGLPAAFKLLVLRLFSKMSLSLLVIR